ncbi:ABC transporter permease subunit [Paenibacillus sp. BC26]|uniref:ABC transporter permease subunit n=1 Tax=Paenibacillus sp. BC26 TaxID=1881032 RepID=UPI0008EDFB71|nr:ABC transporter permease subunit [Paenibacillus sp. BC26]SFS54274.1 ABC-type dipeptide/oligopeptide/nickel transport system, permease component [Paenibacillus sp. BC26]
MIKAAQYSTISLGILSFVFVFAMIPDVLMQGHMDGSLHFLWSNGLTSFEDYLAGIANGDAFRFLSGKTERSFWAQIGSSLTLTFSYMAVGAVIGMTLGILLGIYFSVTRKQWLKGLLELTSVLPDFVIVLLLQVLIVLIADKTGLVMFQVASFTTDDPAIALPLISTIIIPGIYMIRNVALHMSQTLTEDYISFAKARGLGKRYIIFFHALPNVLPFVRADVHKFLGILFGNLFIFEYLYNLNGVTLLVFSNAYAYEGYQYNLVVNGLFTLLLLYAVMLLLMKVLIAGWEKVFVR